MQSLFSLLFENTISEAITDHEVTRISRLVINDIKKYFLNTELEQKLLTYQSVYGFPIFFEISKTENGINDGKVRMDTDTDKTEFMNFRVALPMDFMEKSLYDIVFMIKQNLTHEFEHIRQGQRGMKIATNNKSMLDDISPLYKTAIENPKYIKSDPEYAIAYYNAPHEVEAHVVQIFKRGKMDNKTFSEALEVYLRQKRKNFTFNDEEKDLVINSMRKTYRAYAKKRFPKLKL